MHCLVSWSMITDFIMKWQPRKLWEGFSSERIDTNFVLTVHKEDGTEIQVRGRLCLGGGGGGEGTLIKRRGVLIGNFEKHPKRYQDPVL